MPAEELWNVFIKVLHEVSIQYHAHIISFVLMTNHYHLLVETPDGNLGSIMNYLQREVSRSVGRISGRINHVFGGTYRGTLIEQDLYLYNVYRYIYQNPVAAKLCTKVEHYPYSTLKYLLAKNYPLALSDFIAENNSPIPGDLKDRLVWLNRIMTQEQRNLISRALKKSTCEFPRKYTLRKVVRSLHFDAVGFQGK